MLVDFIAGNQNFDLRLRYLVTILCIVIVSRGTIHQIQTGHIAIATIIILCCYYQYSQCTKSENNATASYMTQLKEIDPQNNYPYLYYDMNLMMVLYSAIALRDMNGKAFHLILKNTSEVLKRERLFQYHQEFPIRDPHATADVAEKYATEAVAQFHSLVYSLPPERQAYRTLYQSCLDDYRVMMLNHVHRIYAFANDLNDQKAIDVSTTPTKKPGKPRPINQHESAAEKAFYFFE